MPGATETELTQPAAEPAPTTPEPAVAPGSAPPENLTPFEMFKSRAMVMVETKYFTGIMLVATVMALWASDVYEAINPAKHNDTGMWATMFICFILFVTEFAILCVCKEGYFLTFFFWLDLIAALSLLPDVLLLFGTNILSSSGGSSLTVARAGRAARAGTRAARIVRVIKLIALVKKGREKQGEEEVKESKIGGQLADLITQKVIVIVGAMLISTSLLDLIATTSDYNFIAELENLELMYDMWSNTSQSDIFVMYFSKFIVDHDIKTFDSGSTSEKITKLEVLINKTRGTNEWPYHGANWLNDTGACDDGRSLRWVRIRNRDMWCTEDNADDLREAPSEFELFETDNDSAMILDQTKFAQGQAVVNIVQILFIVILLGVSSALFNRDAEKLVIQPLAKMASLVQKMSANPLADIEDSGEGGEYETDFVESALKKFGKLLQVAFGEAGAEIIGANMSSGGDLNLMMAGRKLDAIFGFIVVFHFAECTECLQEEIMTFVNQVADYIHKAVSHFEGFTNKNIGEAWLLAWRMPDAPEGEWPKSNTGFTKADSALKSFVRIALQTSVCPKLSAMTDHPKIQEKLPGYKIHMGFGLHVGWAIQGAIGSELKIDASFLSPNVNLASRLEAANHQFGTTILFSGQFYSLMNSEVQQLCRKVDRVTVKGSAKPMDFWTFDVPFKSFESLADLELRADVPFFEQYPPWTSAEYRAKYAICIQHYLDGRWKEAGQILDECLREYPDDGPGLCLMNVLRKRNYQAPEDWKGYRELTEK